MHPVRHTEGIFYTDWGDVMVAFFEDNPKVKNELLTAKVEPTAEGIARFLNSKCKAGITEVNGRAVGAPQPPKKAEL